MSNIGLPVIKMLKSNPLKIGTHNGAFHCDELLGTYMLQKVYPKSVIIRSRDINILNECDIVIDVGGEYNPSTFRFDHHQHGFTESMSSITPGKHWTTKLSSAGLVYCHFGKQILSKIVGERSDAIIDAIYDYVYENFIQEIDAIDNGVPMFDGEPRYQITTNLNSRVSRMNKQWNISDDFFNEEEAFAKAQLYVGTEFESTVTRAADVWWPARELVLNAIKNCRAKVHDSGLIMELEQHCPWKNHFFELEKELNVEPPILFAIFRSSVEDWRVQAVSLNPGTFVCRLFLHNEWRGLRDEKLSKIANIDGCLFVHHNGFIGGNKTREGALEMALKTIELNK